MVHFAKSTKNQTHNNTSTSIIASTLMQKMMLTNHQLKLHEGQLIHNNHSFIKQRQQNQDKQKNSLVSRIQENTSKNTKNININLEYQQVSMTNFQKRNSFLKSMKNTKCKLLRKDEIQSAICHKQSKLGKLLKSRKNNSNITNVHQNNEEQNNEQIYDVNRSQRKYAKKLKQDSSPKKVSVNFQLYFPKTKIKSYSQQKNETRRSIDMNSVDKNIFRIKKSFKQINTHYHDSSPERRQNDFIVAIGKLSSQKYVQKIEKFKKFKNNQMNKQLKFGLNVIPAEYHGLKNKTISKDYQIESQQVQNNIRTLGECGNIQNSKIAQESLQLTQKGASFSFNDPKTIHLQDEYQQQSPQSQTMQKSDTRMNNKTTIKCPSDQKLLKKTLIRVSQMQKKKILIKNKYHQTSYYQHNAIKVKLNNMIKNLDEVLNSYCCRIGTSMTISAQNNDSVIKQLSQASNSLINSNLGQISTINKQKKQKYLYFVGSGNNRNLIKSVMKKRFWWSQTDKIQQANFVWTQIKMKQILQKQEKLSDKKIEQPDSWNFKRRQNEQIEKEEQISKTKKVKKNQEEDQKQNFTKIFHKNMMNLFYQKIDQKRPQYLFLRQLNIPSVIHNHYDANYMLGNKKALFFNLIQYGQYKKVDVYNFIPMTFHIEKVQSRQYKNFLKEIKKTKNALWIVKPGENSNRGNGIFVQKSIQKIKSHIQKYSNKHSFIVQKYLKNIFLYNRRKFDIRTYMLMVTIGGITKFFWYNQGYLRTSSQIYQPNDITDLFIHLTNDAIQSKNQTYSKYEKGNKISYTEFQRYLDANYPDQKYNVKELVEKMKEITQIVVRATYSKLDKAKKTNGFELFGLDFLIDSNFQPWLLQVNTNPCLELSSPVLQRLIPRMVENMFRISLDPIYRPPNENISKNLSYFLYDNIFETNRFQLIFDSLFDSNFEWQEICEKQKDIEYKDDDQVFDDNGEQLQLNE